MEHKSYNCSLSSLIVVLALFKSILASASPLLDSVSKGAASISSTATTTTITQTSHSTTLNWNSYNINQGHTITYNQPSTSSIAINNIKDTNPSQILGNINANGRIILLNPNGFYIGPNSTISANTFIAAAANLQQTTYNQNTNTLTLNNPQQTLTGDITLHGTITTTNTTQLIAHHINQNTQATITATNHIALKATHTISLHATHTTTANNSSIDLFANQAITGGGSTNSNTTTFTTSYLSLTGDYTATNTTLNASNILLNTDVTINATTTTIHATNSAIISATIHSHAIKINANNNLSFLHATISANSNHNPLQEAGTIHIGSTTTPPNNINITNSTLSVNSTNQNQENQENNNNAGIIIIYGTNTTFNATATATAITGDGGFIEISAANRLQLNPVHLSTLSTHGSTGTILIDPDFIVITNQAQPRPTPVIDLYRSFIASLNPSFGTLYDGQADSDRGTFPASTVSPPTLGAESYFGYSVALSDTHALIGAPRLDNASFVDAGSAYLYNISTNTWTDLATTPMSPVASLAADSNFGFSVALSDTHALIGAPGIPGSRGDAYLYRLDGTNAFTNNCATTGTATSPWCNLLSSRRAPTASLGTPSFGISVALNDTYALIGASRTPGNRGNAYLYNIDGGDAFTSNCSTSGTLTSPWCTLSQARNQPITSLISGSEFGISVALNDTYALIGSPSRIGIGGIGNAYLYRLDGTNAFTNNCATTGTATSPWCSLTASRSAPTVPAGSRFGFALALNDTYALISARRFDDSRGNAYLYRLDGEDEFTSTCATTATPGSPVDSPWCNLSTVTRGNPIAGLSANSFFGTSVALNDTYALIGAIRFGSEGEAFLYRLDGEDGFTSSCATTAAPGSPLTSPWCTLSTNPHIGDTGNLPFTIDFGRSVALTNTYALVGAVPFTPSENNAFLINLDSLSEPIGPSTNYISPSTVDTLLQAGDIVLSATTDISVLASVTYTGPNTLTLTSMGTINANPLGVPPSSTSTAPIISVETVIINADGDIGSATNPISLSPTATITLNAGTNDIYLSHPTDILPFLTATYTANTLFLTQAAGDINITTAINRASDSLEFIAQSGSISIGASITLSSLVLRAQEAITPTDSSNTITATTLDISTMNGDIGSADNPFEFIRSSGDWGADSLSLTTNGSIFIESADSTNLLFYLDGTITSNSVILTQTTGDFVLNGLRVVLNYNLVLTIENGSIVRMGDSSISAYSLMLNTPNGNIGTEAEPIRLERVTGSWDADSLRLSTGSGGAVYLTQDAPLSYLSGIISANELTITQTAGDFIVAAPFTLSGTLSITNFAGSILRSGNGSITASTLILNTPNGAIGSATHPIALIRTSGNWGVGSLSLATGSLESIFLSQTSSATYLDGTITTGSVSISQLNGDFIVSNSISVSNYSLSLVSVNGSIVRSGDASITAPSLSLRAPNGDIGTAENPFILTRTAGEWSVDSLFLSSRFVGSVYLAQSSQPLIEAYLRGTIITGTLSLTQTSGTLSITSNLFVELERIGLQYTALSLIASNGDVTLNDSITLDVPLFLQGVAISSTSSDNKLTLLRRNSIVGPRLSLVTTGTESRDIGSNSERFYISSGVGEVPDFDVLRIEIPNGGVAFLRRDGNAINTVDSIIAARTATESMTIFDLNIQDVSTGSIHTAVIGRNVVIRVENDYEIFNILSDALNPVLIPLIGSIDFLGDIIEPIAGDVFEGSLNLIGSGCETNDFAYVVFGGFACSDYDVDLVE